MQRIGILGGMSASSTQGYYAELCRLTQHCLGGLHSPQLLIRSVDFADIEKLQMQGDWEAAGALLNQEARDLERGGAELLILATNTMHKLADQMLTGVRIPFLHIGDATAAALQAAGAKRPALMATAFTMEESFYTDRLKSAGLAPILPTADDRAYIHRIIYDELCQDIISEDSRKNFIAITERLKCAGADAVILGCTEIGLLLNAHNAKLPVFDTTLIHCRAALEAALSPPL